MIYSRRQYLPDSCRRRLYFSLVNSRLLYGIQVYSETKKNILDPLHISCNRVLRALQGVNRSYNVKRLYNNYDVLPVHLLGNLSICKLVYKCVSSSHNHISSATCNLFRLNNANHAYATRLSSSNYLYKKSCKAFYSSYVNMGCTLWNQIPAPIRNSPSATIFASAYKKFLIDNW